VEFDALLLFDRRGDLGSRDRTEEFVLICGSGRDGHRIVDERGGDLFGCLPGGRIALLTGPTHVLGLGFGPRRRVDREATGHEVVPAVTGGHFDDIAFVAESVDIGPEDETHHDSVSSTSVSSPSTASAGASPSAPGGGAVGRGGGPSARTPRSPPRSRLPRG